mmetsp:Transcript_12244/g.14919  ORF Transcript_12244/g.14919 Transcript_12244/m.14919 type:complete len:298 (-) Transcript_12244:601-1494(-)|eukprot:CAMPEP_0194364704 /NCGR_PEP_ID=MMETSP0174-20130528/12601_1 /TAXON_ID=216777 /ORGANISM="Proboscia alata, Strain PI-D3" /LENGTH=297 /DNA_ID=CAMNT_0039138871 /DNA_START=90 /DNA_END=983 /DNA_ORIENTATION=-
MAATSENDCRFRGKSILITGAGGSFGREGCLYFASRGAIVAGLDKNKEALEETASYVKSQLGSSNANPLMETFECDVTNVESVSNAVSSSMGFFSNNQCRSIDMLWNNAGYQGQIKPTLEYDPNDFDLVMKINVTGMFIVLQAVAKQMVSSSSTKTSEEEQQTSFSIVNTASVAGLRGTPAMVAYASSKAAVLAMTTSTSKDLAPYNIRVNAVSPALIGPGYMWDRQNILHAASGSPYFDSDPKKVAANKVNSVPLKRLGTVQEVLKSVAFLLSDDASYTTGTNLVVDGGMSSGLKA